MDISRLKSELSWLRRKGAIRVGGLESISAPRACGRCQTELGLILNRGALCPSCRQRICKECRQHGPLGKEWVCIVCSKQIEIQLATGEWMNEFIRRPSRRRDKNLLSAAEGVRKTLLRRSWSISSPTTSSCDLNTQEDIVKQNPPKKPPRKSLVVDENEPFGDIIPPSKPPRHNSMTSFDGRHSLRGTPDSGSRKELHESTSFLMPPEISLRKPPARTLSTQHLGPSEPPRYFFGSEPFKDCTRPSTLPRRPRHCDRPLSFGDFEDKSSRFYSIPRTRAQRSPSGARGQSEPPPLKESPSPNAYVSSGPVTSTPISPTSHNGPSFPILRQENVGKTSSIRSESHRGESGGFVTSLRRESPDEETQKGDEDGRVDLGFRRLSRQEAAVSIDSAESESSAVASPHISDEGKSSPTQKAPVPNIPRSNASVTSGFGHTVRPKRASSAPVRRCKSLQARNSRNHLEEELCCRRISGIQVARFVFQLEKRIHETMENMNPRKTTGLRYSDSFKETPSSVASKNSLFVSSLSDRENNISPERLSSNLSSSKALLPEGNDYKIVFVSSDSYINESDLNSSLEYETTSYDASGSFHEPSSVRRRASEGTLKQLRLKDTTQNRLVDAAVMTDTKNSSSDEDGEGCSLTTSEKISLSFKNEEKTAEDVRRSSWGGCHWHSPKRSFGDSEHTNARLVPPLNALDANEFELMLQQTKVVQAEAQALQKALMGAFDLSATPLNVVQSYPKDEPSLNQNLMNSIHGAPTTNEHPNFQIMKEITNDVGISPSFKKSFPAYIFPKASDVTHNEYENSRLFTRARDNENSYENVNFRSGCIKPIKVCKSVSIQTDLDPLSGEDEDSYETVDYSDVSFDSQIEERRQSPFHSERAVPPATLSDRNARDPSLSHRGFVIRAQNECNSGNRGKGEESLFVPPFSYLPEPPPSTTLPLPLAVHLRLASDRDSSSVSLSSECEAVCESTSGNRGRAGAVFKPSESEKDAIKAVPHIKVNALTTRSFNPQSVSGCGIRGDPIVRRFEVQKATSDESSSTQPKRSLDLTSGGNNSPHPPKSNLKSCKAKEDCLLNLFRMSSKEAPETPSSDFKEEEEEEEASTQHPPSNVNASEEVISHQECDEEEEALPAYAGDVVREEHSSGTSEGDDTDEEMHVSRSYDVSKPSKADPSESDGAFSNHSENRKASSSSSESNTDEDNHFNEEYDVTKASSQWESENGEDEVVSGDTKEINHAAEKTQIIDPKEQTGAISDTEVDLCKSVINEDIKADKIINKTDVDYEINDPLTAKSDKCAENQNVSGDKLEKSAGDGDNLNDNENCSKEKTVSILDTVKKTNLPEGDQGMRNDSELKCNNEADINGLEIKETTITTNLPFDDGGELCPKRSEDGAPFAILDSVVENKSETKSNLGLECEVSEPINEIAENSDKRNQSDGLEHISEGEEICDPTATNLDSEEHREDKKQASDVVTTNITADNEVNAVIATENNLKAYPDKREALSDKEANEYATQTKSTTDSEEIEREDVKVVWVDEGETAVYSDQVTEMVEVEGLASQTENKEGTFNNENENLTINCDEKHSTNLSYKNQSILRREDETSGKENRKDNKSVNSEKSGNIISFNEEGGRSESTDEKSAKLVFENLESQVSSEALQSTVANDTSEKQEERPNKTSISESDTLKNKSESTDRKSNDFSECTATKITGSAEVEQQQSGGHKGEAVPRSTLSDSHEKLSSSDVSETCNLVKDKVNLKACDFSEEVSECSIEGISKSEKEKVKEKEICSSGESGHSSGGESEVESKDLKNVVKINVADKEDDSINEADSKGDGSLFFAMGTAGKGLKQEPPPSQGSFQGLVSTKFSKSFTPPVPLRKAKRSSSSDGLSSSSDIERSDADASDSADTVIEGNRLHSKTYGFLKQSSISDEVSRDSDGLSSADSVLQGADSESQCSDGSEEGNLISIVAVGEETIPRPSSQGKIYIRSDLTDSDVQIKPTCIVVTGSSGAESEDESDNDNQVSKNNVEGNDVTILEVTSDHRRDHVMSVRVTSPESSRSASPARKSNVSELQSMILTTRERQQQFRRSTEMKEPSSLTNYFTVTLGTDSPATPRRFNKTPEVRRRKVPERELSESPSSPVTAKTFTSTLTPSPSHTPSPTLTPTPERNEGDLLAYDDHASATDESSDKHPSLEGDSVFDGFYNEYDDHYDSYNDLEVVQEEAEGAFDSIDDAESVGESNYSETSSEEGFEREEELRGYCKRGYDFTLHTIIEESCEESDYDKKVQEDDSVKRDPSELEKYFYFGLGNGPAESKKYANEESEYSDTFSETSSSIYSEGMESLDCEEMDPAELASSRLEKYFSGFAGFERQPSIRSVGEESELLTDESGSVGSDSEGSPSPEQPRKRLFRSRGVRSVSSSRSHGYSSDKGEGVPSDGSHHSGDGDGDEKALASGEDEGSTESDEMAFDKGDGQFDTIKRRKKKKIMAELAEKKMETTPESKDEALLTKKGENNKKCANDCESTSKKNSEDDLNNAKDKLEEVIEGDLAGRRYQSRDSGFIGSSDDLLRDKSEDPNLKEADTRENQPSAIGYEEAVFRRPREKTETVVEARIEVKPKEGSPDNDSNNNEERSSNEGKVSRSSTGSSVDLPPYSQSKGSHNLTRKDSFNNWSSDEETNIMMNKMRIFFKNMFSNVPKEVQKGQRVKSPQLVMFEAKLTNLMRSVPGINDEQVKEIVEYLSSEETWSDSYDSSDYTSSDLEGAYARLDRADPELKSELQEQISASCQQIIKKFDQSREPSDTDSAHSLFGGRANSESSEASSKDTAFVYQKLMSSMSHMKPDSDRGSIGSGSQSTSPSLLMKVMPYIRDRLVVLMHEVSAGSENGDDADSFNGGTAGTPSPRQKLFLPKKHNLLDNISLDSSVDKSSITSTSFESEDSPTDTEQSPESETGTPKIYRCQKLSIISERSSTEDFTSLESQRTVFSSHGSPRHHFRLESSKLSHSTPSQRSLEDRSGTLSSVQFGRGKDDERLGAREHIGLSKASRKGSRPEARKAKSHLSLEKIHHEEMKATGERSESLGDLLDRVRSSSEFSSSYEHLDSDSTLKASDSLERHIGSSSSNVRLNASSRGSLTTSSRGSLATSSRGSLNASSRGSLHGSSGPDEEEERKAKKLSFFRYARRSSVPDASKDTPSAEVRSTTLPRSTPAQILTTGTLPRSQSSQPPPSRSPSSLLASHFSSGTSTSTDRPSVYHSSGPRSARYHPPGYRPPPSGLPPKRTFSTPTLRKDRLWPASEEGGSCVEDAVSTASSGGPGGPPPNRAPPPPSSLAKMGSGSPLGSPLGRTSGNDSVGGSLASFDNSPDEEEAKRRDSDGGRSPLVALGPKSRSESLASVYSSVGEGRFGAVSVQGEVRVALQYNYKEGQLECHIIQSRDLAPVDTKRNRTDPYVKAYLLPDKSKSGKRKTKVKRHTLNPVFDEIFKFGTTLSEMESRTLWISVWHSDMFGRNVFLGEVLIPLSDALFEDSSPRWYPLLDRNEPMEDLNYGAVLIVALKFVPPDVLVLGGGGGGTRRSKRSRGALQVRVKEASGLAASKSQNPPDPICKGVLMPEKGKASKQKTNIIRKTSSPKWNHTMTFDDVTLQELTERSLELSIFNHDRFGSSEFLGGCRMNLGRGQHKNRIVEWLDASGLEQKLWEQMLDRPNLWVESSILLRPNIERPIYSSAFTD